MADEPAGGSGSGLEKSLTKKIGGVPAWSIGVILGAALIIFFVMRSKKAATGNNNPQSTDPNADTSNNASQLDPNAIDPNTGLTYGEEGYGTQGFPNSPINSYLAQDPTNPAYPVGLTPQGLPGPVTNAQWSTLAADWLMGKGNDPTLVQSGLANYLAGKPLSEGQKAIIDIALQTFGSPPGGVLAPVTTAPAAPGTVGGLKHGTVTKNSIQIEWGPVAGATKYYVYEKKGSAFTWVATVNAPSTTFTHGGLQANHNYTWAVAALNTVGSGPKSSPLTVKTEHGNTR